MKRIDSAFENDFLVAQNKRVFLMETHFNTFFFVEKQRIGFRKWFFETYIFSMVTWCCKKIYKWTKKRIWLFLTNGLVNSFSFSGKVCSFKFFLYNLNKKILN